MPDVSATITWKNALKKPIRVPRGASALQRGDRGPEEDAEEDDGQHVARGGRRQDVRRHDCRGAARPPTWGCRARACSSAATASPREAPTPGPEQVDDDEAGGRGEEARQQVVAHRLAEETSEWPARPRWRRPGDDGGDDQRNDDHAQQPHEQVADPADGVRAALAEDQAGEGAEEHGAEDLPVELEVPEPVLVDVHGLRGPRGELRRWAGDQSAARCSASASSRGVSCRATTARACSRLARAGSGACEAASVSHRYAAAGSCGTPVAVGVQDSEVLLRGRIAPGRRRAAEPARRLGRVPRDPRAGIVAHPQVELRPHVPLLGREPDEPDRLREVPARLRGR